jgi:DNA repair protein SbcD/Mre11
VASGIYDVKILHAADLHIDSPLGGLTAYEGAPVDEIRGATRRATENLVQAAIDHEVSLVLLAGDIFDGDWPDYSTGLFWNEQLARLNASNIPVVSVAGNHDAQSQISRSLRPPPNVTQLSTAKPERVVFDDLELEVIGQGYATRDVKADLTEGYPVGDPNLLSIGLLHTSLNGRPGHANYAPTTVDALRSKGYQYWALGHVHTREEVHCDPWIVFPGNLQGRHAKETGAKGASLLTVDAREVVSVEHLPLDDVRWARCEVSAEELASVDDVFNAIAERFSDITIDAGQRLAAVRVQIVGSSPAHEELWSDPHGFEAHVRAMANQSGRLWVEKVKLNTTRALDLATTRGDDAVGLLGQRIASLRSDSVALAAYTVEFENLRRKIGADARTPDGAAFDTSRIATAEHLAESLDASLELVVRLLAEERA